MSLNTTIAYPYTRSNRIKDKILSEVMMTTLVKSITPEPSFWINSEKTKLVLGGYYFELASYPGDDKYVYCFVERDEEFPQLLNYISMAPQQDPPSFDEQECLFITSSSIDNGAEPADGQLDFLHRDGDDLYFISNSQNIYINYFGGKCSDIPVISDVYSPFYISLSYDNSKKSKIWIKLDTMNPFVYDENYFDMTTGHWCPLGAVYKTGSDQPYVYTNVYVVFPTFSSDNDFYNFMEQQLTLSNYVADWGHNLDGFEDVMEDYLLDSQNGPLQVYLSGENPNVNVQGITDVFMQLQSEYSKITVFSN